MCTFNEIQKANESIITTDIKGKDYAEVNQRVKAFRICHPNGSIETEIISLENGVVTIRAKVFGESRDLLATGIAQEKETSSYINKTSFIENCETSAVGRALGFCGFGIDTSIASFEEVANAIENQAKKEDKKQVPGANAPQHENQPQTAEKFIQDKYRLSVVQETINGTELTMEKVLAWIKAKWKKEIKIEDLTNDQFNAMLDAMKKAVGK